MKLLPNVQFCISFPMYAGGAHSSDKLLTVVNDPKIVFVLKQFGLYELLDKNRLFRYHCLSCEAYTGQEYLTSEFKVYGSKEIPNFIQEEMEEHVKNHQQLGYWGIQWYKENYK